MSRVVGNVHGHMILRCLFCLLSIIECIDSSAHSSTSVRSSSRFQLLAISAILHGARFGARSAMVSVLPSGIDVRKLQRSHSEISRVEPLSDLPKLRSHQRVYPT